MDSPRPLRATFSTAARLVLIAAGALLGFAAPQQTSPIPTPRHMSAPMSRWSQAGALPALADELPSQRLFLPSLTSPGVTWFTGFPLANAGGPIGPMILRGHRVYVGEGRRVTAYEVGDSGAPRLIASSSRMDTGVVDLTMQGSFLFAKTAGSKDFPYGVYHVFEVSADPVDGRLLAFPYSEAIRSIYDLSFHGQTAYICEATGLRVMDASNPRHLTPMGALPVPDGITDCQRSDSGLLVARCARKCGNQDSRAPEGYLWRVIDVRDPANLRIVRELGDDWVPGAGEISGYLLSGDRLYLQTTSHGTGQHYTGLRLYDVSDPLNWRVGGNLGANQLEACAAFGPAEGSRVYGGGRATCIYDWSDVTATQPRLATTLNLPSGVKAAEGDRLAVISGYGGYDLRVFDLAGPDAPHTKGAVGMIGAPRTVAGRGSTRVAVSGNRVSLLDSSQPGLIRVAATWDAASYVDGDYGPISPSIDHRLPDKRLPVFDGKDLQVVDLDPSASPMRAMAVRLFDDPAPGVLAAQGQLVVVAARDSSSQARAKAAAIVVIQVDPAGGLRVIGRVDLAQLASQNPGIRFTSARIEGDRAYLTTAQPATLAIVDLSRPAAPMVRRWLPLEGALSAVAVRGDVAYVAAGDAGLHVVRVAVPEEAEVISSVEAGQAIDLSEAVGPKFPVLYVADAKGKLWLFDIGDPERPKQYSYAFIDGEVQGISIDADDPRAEVWVAAGSGGLFRFGWLLSAIP